MLFKAMNNENMWYNGPYTMTSYIQGNEKVFTKNPLYWDTECKLFNTVTIKMVESSDVAFQLYQAGDLDYVDLTESALTTICKRPEQRILRLPGTGGSIQVLLPDPLQLQQELNEDGTQGHQLEYRNRKRGVP